MQDAALAIVELLGLVYTLIGSYRVFLNILNMQRRTQEVGWDSKNSASRRRRVFSAVCRVRVLGVGSGFHPRRSAL